MSIDEADADLLRWIASTVPQVPVVWGNPRSHGGATTVFVSLSSIIPNPPDGTSHPDRRRIRARYALSVQGEDRAAAHRHLGSLLFAALDHPQWRTEAGGPPAEGTEAPGFYLEIPVDRMLPQRAAPLVRHPLTLNHAGIQTLSGLVLGPEDLPIAGARVRMVGAGGIAFSDHRGRFQLPGVPSGPKTVELTVEAKTWKKSLKADLEDVDGHDLVVRLGPTEG